MTFPKKISEETFLYIPERLISVGAAALGHG